MTIPEKGGKFIFIERPTNNRKGEKRMSAFTLKLIALVTMIIDHVGAIFFPQFIWLRYIGRLSMPIYAFLLVQGYMHTRNFNRYALRMGIFAFALRSTV